MDKKIVIVAIAILIVAITLAFLIFKESSQLSPTELEECNSLSYSSDNAKNIVFFSTKQQAESYSDYLLSQKPFSEHKDAFNFYYIDDYFPECEIYKGIALLCYSKQLVKKASSCPNDYLVVIQNQPSNIRSSCYMNTLSLNSKHNKNVFLHEFGHAFAFLADEYTPAILPKKSKNCVKSCDEFTNPDKCYQGCSKAEYYRSIDSGIMKTLSSSNFGEFNNQIILNYFPATSSITGQAISETQDCTKEKYYLIEGKYENNKIKILDKQIEQGCIGTSGQGDFEYTLTLQDNSKFEQEFNPELIFTDDLEGGEVIISEENFFLKIPIIENAKSIEISQDQQPLIQINLQGIGARPCKI